VDSKQVEEFHAKFGFPIQGKNRDSSLNPTVNREVKTGLIVVGDKTVQSAENWITPSLTLAAKGDYRLYRAQLIMEEAGECLVALGHGDEVELADALADLIYVAIGTAVTYGIPIEKIFDEVHRSNMSKSRDTDDPRMKAKDPARGYTPPDIEGVLRGARIELA
jgi:phosphoribosyl-ATP pyrophosphohydrolase